MAEYSKYITYQEGKIEKLLYEMSSIYTDIQLREEFGSNISDDVDFEIETDNIKSNFIYMGDRVYKLCLSYFEFLKLPNYNKSFSEDIIPLLTSKKALDGTYAEGSGQVHSVLIDKFWSYLLSFPAFGEDDNETLLKRTGIIYLENILESTSVIIKQSDIVPKNEAQVYKAVKILTMATFPSASFPTQSFQKVAKHYIPDILIPSLNCAVEYKYANTETDLIRTIDEILIDVKGYDKHPVYKLFYAVFYTKSGIWTKQRFDKVWDEKEFPENWKGIFVES